MTYRSADLTRSIKVKGAFIALIVMLLTVIVVPAYAVYSSTYEAKYYGPGNNGKLGNSIYLQNVPGHAYSTSGGSMAQTANGSDIFAIGSASKGKEYCGPFVNVQRWYTGWVMGANASWVFASGSTGASAFCLPDPAHHFKHWSYGYWFDPVQFSPYVEKNFSKECYIFFPMCS